MDIDMDLDLGPMPENEQNQTVSLLRSPFFPVAVP